MFLEITEFSQTMNECEDTDFLSKYLLLNFRSRLSVIIS